jgi:hypothetical protein
MADLDVVVGTRGGKTAGGGVEVEAEHRLQVMPVDLHCPAPHPPLGGRGKPDGGKMGRRLRANLSRHSYI